MCKKWFGHKSNLKLHVGTVHEKECIEAKGDPTQRLSTEEVRGKYMESMDFADTFSRKTTETAADMTLSLDCLEDVSELVSLLTFPDK